MLRRARAAGLLALLLLLAPALEAVAQGGTGAPRPTMFEPLPQELLALMETWRVDAAQQVNATRERADQDVARGLDRAKADQVLAVQRARYLGGWDFLNESRLGLAMSQLSQVDTEARLLGFLATPAAGELDPSTRNESQRRQAARAMLDDLGNQSRAALDGFLERLRRDEAKLRTTEGLELALLAAGVAHQGESLLSTARQFGDQVNTSVVVDERVLRFALGVQGGPRAYAAWAQGILDLALQRDALPGMPPLPPGVKAQLRDNVTLRLHDGQRASTTGLHSGRAKAEAEAAANDTSVLWYVTRYVAFQESRSADALSFLQEQGQATSEQLRTALQRGLDNRTLGATYDGRFRERTDLAIQLGDAGYRGLHLTDARNHAWYVVVWEPPGQPTTYSNLLGAWAQMVGAEESGELLTQAAATPARPRPEDAPWLLLGGIAVVVALGVLAFALMRRPKGA